MEDPLKRLVARTLARLDPSVLAWQPLIAEAEPARVGKGESVKEEQASRTAKRILLRLAHRFEETIAERCVALDIDRFQEDRGRRMLDQLGLAKEAGRLEKRAFFCPTKKGWQWVIEKNLGFQQESYQSLELHEVIVRRLKRRVGEEVSSARFQDVKPIGGVRPDAFMHGPEGLRVAVQVSVTNSAKYEAERLVALVKGGVDRAVMVAVDQKKERAVLAALKRELGRWEDQVGQGGQETAREKIVVVRAGEVLFRKVDWERITGGTAG